MDRLGQKILKTIVFTANSDGVLGFVLDQTFENPHVVWFSQFNLNFCCLKPSHPPLRHVSGPRLAVAAAGARCRRHGKPPATPLGARASCGNSGEEASCVYPLVIPCDSLAHRPTMAHPLVQWCGVASLQWMMNLRFPNMSYSTFPCPNHLPNQTRQGALSNQIS